MSRTLSIMTMHPNETILINGHTYKTDANCVVEFELNDVLVSEEQGGLVSFDATLELEENLSKAQRVRLYRLLVNNSMFSKREAMAALGGVEKQIVDRIVNAAMNDGIVKRQSCQWRIVPDMRDQVNALVRRLTNTELPSTQKSVEEEKEEVAIEKEMKFNLKDTSAISEEELVKPRKLILRKEKALTIPKKRK